MTTPGPIRLAAAILALGLAAGCASPYSPSATPARRIAENRELYESWPSEIQMAILDQKIEKGMTREMVTMALGRPSRTTLLNATGEELWVYGVDFESDGGGGGSNTSLSLGTTIPMGNMGGVSVGQSIPVGSSQQGRSDDYREITFKDGVVTKGG